MQSKDDLKATLLGCEPGFVFFIDTSAVELTHEQEHLPFVLVNQHSGSVDHTLNIQFSNYD